MFDTGEQMFGIGETVQLAEQLVGGTVERPVGTVIGRCDDGDVIVRWATGLETALAPHSLAPTG
jgi:hypothetical protein